MIEKILIANRGEIAIRVIKTCNALGIKSVAVYSDEDVNSKHVKMASESYHIGPPSPSQSYLNMETIAEAALNSGADAIHPGYGFLSENADFADLCEKKKLNFIGPSGKSMRLCGDKMLCKSAMAKAKVPTVPGSPGIVEEVEKALDIANNIGYPVLLKSVFGGGGRGIRLVHNEKELKQAFELASGESKAAFGKSALFVEKFLPKIRHIEFQLARDKHGNAVHIFERECSIQRRHQKLIEMSPSPVVDQKTRDEIGQLAVNAAIAVDYHNAGTAEFLRLDDGTFYFIEINARLQVEHPVTEFVSGLDLVKLQIDIANGKEIPFKQKDLKVNGCAIECRINAEDTFLDFAPSTGRIYDVNIPSGPGVRVDTYLYPGCSVSPYYDSLMGKLITWGQNFEEARQRMQISLADFYIEGVETAIPLYRTILDTKEFISGDLSTDFLDRFKILDRLRDDLKKEASQKSDAALAATLMHSEFLKTRIRAHKEQHLRWKAQLDRN
ncbi:MAG TPA: acetyl-CoA carboxylase biotin carboxylase subunit [Candidatus Nitrosotalea sp.]|nr:acetyl-CoA carboxylase biotin carboxylase subunit [Nitrososphaerota archaeon]HKU33826.1 acetyl-CoA carboxylase biotin carboxylase subunit [Candidatus Nitrosotalea sp.]